MTARLSSRHRRKLKEAVSCEKMMAKRKPVILSEDVAKFPCDCGGLPCDDGCCGDVSLRVCTLWFCGEVTSEGYSYKGTNQASILTWQSFLPTHGFFPRTLFLTQSQRSQSADRATVDGFVMMVVGSDR
jgi:hypothetical protein